MTITIYAETMIQYTAAATNANTSPDGTPAKTISSSGATPTYANAGTASDRSVINFTDSNRAALGTFNFFIYFFS